MPTYRHAPCGLALVMLLSGTASADLLDPDPPGTLRTGNYDCTTRNGRVLEGRGFTILDAHSYAAGNGSGGNYEIKGERVYFDLGKLDGKQVRILSSGRLKYSSDIFCIYSSSQDEFIPETAQPDVPPGSAQPSEADPNTAAPPAADPNTAPALQPAPAGLAPAEAKPAEPVPPKLIKVDPNKADPRLQPVDP